MKKIIKFIFTLFLFFVSSSMCLACNEKKEYNPELLNNFSANGFEITTTSDFQKMDSFNTLKLKSTGDNKVNFGDTYINMHSFAGNSSYEFANKTLKQYSTDIAKVEGVTLTQSIDLTIVEKFSDESTSRVYGEMFIVDESQNVNGNWDFYSIYYFAKLSKSFIYVNVYTSIQDEFYNDNITKLKAIIASIKFTQPELVTYNELAKSYMSSTTARTENVFSHWGFEMTVSTDYRAYVNENYLAGNHLQTLYSLEENWSSRISCSNLASFFGNAVLEDDGAKHFVKFSKNGNLGFYTKCLEEGSTLYRVYHLDLDNKLNVNYIKIYLTCSEELNNLDFETYFEEQIVEWIKNIDIIIKD